MYDKSVLQQFCFLFLAASLPSLVTGNFGPAVRCDHL
jgi:hypothetical protein